MIFTFYWVLNSFNFFEINFHIKAQKTQSK